MKVWLQSLVRHGILQRIPNLLKASGKLLIRAEDLYDQRLLRLALDEIKPSDTFLCSYPKSGNTWLRFLIANLLCENTEMAFTNIQTWVPEIERDAQYLNRLKIRPVMKTHWPFFDRFPRFIYICRDPRDAMISYYHYSVSNAWFQGTLSEFVRSALPNYYGDWGAHVEAALAEFSKRPQDVCMLKYEHVLEDPQVPANRVADFLGLKRSQCQIENAVNKSRFDNLRSMEMKHGPETSRHAAGFFRVGKARQWVQAMNREDQEFLCKRFGATMAKVGYESD